MDLNTGWACIRGNTAVISNKNGRYIKKAMLLQKNDENIMYKQTYG